MAFNITGPTTTKGGYVEILKFPVGDQAMASIVLDASTVAPDASGNRILKGGTLLSKNSNNQYERFTGASAASEVSTLTITGATGGTYALDVDVEGDTQTTAALAHNANAAAIEAAVEALSNVVGVTVTGVGPFTITFVDPANQDVTVTADDDALTPAGSTAVVTTSAEGDVAQAIKGVLAYDVEFVDGTAQSDAPAAMFLHECVFRADRIVDFGTHGAAARAALPTCRFD